MRSSVSLVAAVALLTLPSAALGATGTGAFAVSSPAGGGTQAAHLHFWLAPRYEQLVGALGGNPLIGDFRRPAQQAGRPGCVDDLEASGRAQHGPPVRRGDRLQLVHGREPAPGTRSKYLRVVRSGHTGALRWYVGPTWSWPRTSPNPNHAQLAAVAVMRAPARFVSPRLAWAVVTISLMSSCRETPALQIRELGHAIRTARIVAGPAHAPQGVPTETA